MSSRRSFFSLNADQKFPEDANRNPFQDTHGSSPSQFDSLVAGAMSYWHVPGMAVAVIDRKHIASQGYGVAHLKQDHESNREDAKVEMVTPKTLFDCASMSKSFTAAAMALLVENEEMKDVEWRTPVSKLCSDFVFENEFATENISVEDILSHRSGLPGHEEALRGIHHNIPDTPTSLTRNLRNLPFTRPLRTEYQYSNTLYTAAAHLVETLSESTMEQFLYSQFWSPLEMKRTFLGPDNIPISEQPYAAQGYAWLPSKSQYKPISHDPEPEGIGAGSIQSNVEDFARWICAFIHRSPPLSTTSYDQLSTPRIFTGSDSTPVQYLSPVFYALGWEVSYYHGHTIVKHDGLWAGYASSMLYIPSQEWGFVMMGNSESASQATTELGWHLIDDILQVPVEKRFDWRPYLTGEVEKWRKVDSKEHIFPELKERVGDTLGEIPALERFTGMYVNKGYHEIVLKWNEEGGFLEADCSDRSYSFRIVIKEHAYENWFVAEMIDVVSEQKRAMRCQFEVDRDGKCRKVGLGISEELEGLIWFERTS